MVHTVQVRNRIPQELPHRLFGVVPRAQVLRFTLEGQIKRLLRRLVEADAAENMLTRRRYRSITPLAIANPPSNRPNPGR
jgi:hypothetical protein